MRSVTADTPGTPGAIARPLGCTDEKPGKEEIAMSKVCCSIALVVVCVLPFGRSANAGCTSAADCNDNNPCTHDTCSSRGRCRNVSVAEPESSCTPGSAPPPCYVDVCAANAEGRRVPK